MSVIQLLPDHVANQIAAGEVIQRPASVVKEMVENAIDAGAKSIKIIIKDAGRTLIQIIDDGNGMDEKDALLCFERHATSKLSSADDLFNLKTKGFRGEALASIAAIAHVTLKTRHVNAAELGIRIEVEGSTIKVNEREVCPIGTSFEVKNIFYNVPARRNFLKSDNVEFGHIREELERIALAHPEIGFSLFHNGQVVLELRACILRKRIEDLFGKGIQEKLVPIEEQTDIVKISGFVVKPEGARKTRGEQFLFVNNRFFRDNYFNHAISKAFDGLIADKTFPSYFIYFDINPSKIDVNIHPTKTEIKFEEDRFIYSILLSSVKQSLGKYNIFPTFDFERETSFDVPSEVRKAPPKEPFIEVNPNFNPFAMTTSKPANSGSGRSSGFTVAMKNQGFGTQQTSAADWANFYKIEEEAITEAPKEIALEIENKHSFLIRGNYLITGTKSGMLVIHFKRAHERILYDEMLIQFIVSPLASQQLLFPFEKQISENEKVSWTVNIGLLTQLGFVTEIEGNFLLVHAIPSFLQAEQLHDVLDEINETITHRDVQKADLAHQLVADIARSGSVKFVVNTETQAQQLFDQLFQCENHSFTPGGKKILNTISFDELDQKF